MRALLALLCWVAAVSAAGSGNYQRTATYQNDVVVRCPNKRTATMQVLQAHSDVWNVGKNDIDLRINRRKFARVQHYFPECYVAVANVEEYMQMAEVQMFPQEQAQEQAWVQEVIKEVIPKCNLKQCEKLLEGWTKMSKDSDTWFQKYHNYQEMYNYYKHLANEFSVVSFVPSIGKTSEGRDMPAVHITASNDPDRKRFYMQCQIHAREWITGSVCMYIARHLARNYQKAGHEDVTHLLDNLEFVMIPVVNPDGIAYSWSKDRLWRKNRRKHFGAKCPGVDINRNFPLGFTHTKIEEKSCKEDYGGPEAESEAETTNVINYFRANAPIVGSIDWHSYGQLLLRPYGYTNQSAPDEAFLKKMTEEMAAKAKAVHGQIYTAERSEELYPCYGIGADWLYSDDAAKTNKGYRSASVCIELRSKDLDPGFLLPPDQILPTAEEILPAFMHYAQTMLEKPIVCKNSDCNDGTQPAFSEQHIRQRHH